MAACGNIAGSRDIVGNSPAIRHLRSSLATIGPRPCTVLILGESGTGKELAAQGLHQARNPDSPFITVDCAALTDSLVESQLFGHARGSFTGATEETPGYLRLADGGTVFLDEVGELSLPAQAPARPGPAAAAVTGAHGGSRGIGQAGQGQRARA